MRTWLSVLGYILLSFIACQDATQHREAPAQVDVMATNTVDSVAIANTLHGFFIWYDANLERLGWTRFVDDSTGEHLLLNEDKLRGYLDDLRSSGFVSDELVIEEAAYYRACAKKWATEEKDEIPSGLSIDRFHCAMDYIAPYPTGKVTAAIHGDRAHAVLTLTGEHGASYDFKYDLKKEDGKWLLAKLGCNL